MVLNKNQSTLCRRRLRLPLVPLQQYQQESGQMGVLSSHCGNNNESTTTLNSNEIIQCLTRDDDCKLWLEKRKGKLGKQYKINRKFSKRR